MTHIAQPSQSRSRPKPHVHVQLLPRGIRPDVADLVVHQHDAPLTLVERPDEEEGQGLLGQEAVREEGPVLRGPEGEYLSFVWVVGWLVGSFDLVVVSWMASHSHLVNSLKPFITLCRYTAAASAPSSLSATASICPSPSACTGGGVGPLFVFGFSSCLLPPPPSSPAVADAAAAGAARDRTEALSRHSGVRLEGWMSRADGSIHRTGDVPIKNNGGGGQIIGIDPWHGGLT